MSECNIVSSNPVDNSQITEENGNMPESTTIEQTSDHLEEKKMDNAIFKCYVWNPDTKQFRNWKFIDDTKDALNQSISEGYNAKTTMSFEFEPPNERHDSKDPEPIRKGNLFIDFDDKNPLLAIQAGHDFIIKILKGKYGVDIRSVKCWLSGSKGCHIEIPSASYNDKFGHEYLPLIHKQMLNVICADKDAFECLKYRDNSLYDMGRGHLIRIENSHRIDNRYKVPVSISELSTMTDERMLELVSEPRYDFKHYDQPPIQSPRLGKLFDDIASMYDHYNANYNIVAIQESLLLCGFIKHCLNSAETLSENEQKILLKILQSAEKLALNDKIKLTDNKQINEKISIDNYNDEITKIIRNPFSNTIVGERVLSVDKVSIACDDIKKIHNCDMNCSVKNPIDLCKKNIKENKQKNKNFILKSNGVYYRSYYDNEPEILVCSPLEVVGWMHNQDDFGYARIVKIKTPNNKEKTLPIYMKDFGNGLENVKSQLLDAGVIFEFTNPKINKLLIDYIVSGGENKAFMNTSSTGWITDKIFVLPGKTYGNSDDIEVYFENNATENKYKRSGTLDDWKNNVGIYCKNSPLLVLLTSYALTGSLLEPCNIEGGGINIYGASSTGKTTSVKVAGSICGGGTNKGFTLTWRATANSYESLATQHNHGIMILDELGQATSETVNSAIYMFTNGQGRQRMKSNITLRKAFKWTINYLSTGEMTIADKIKETGKFESYAGQEVRVIDLPIDGNNDLNLFTDIKDSSESKKLCDLLNNNCLKYYGTPLDAFLTYIVENKSDAVDYTNSTVADFTKRNCPVGSSAQVGRVSDKFGLIAAAGEIAINNGILPYEPGDVIKASEYWFKIWLELRKGINNKEVINAIERIKDHFNKYSTTHYPDSNSFSNSTCYGFKYIDNDIPKYLMLTDVFNKLCLNANKRQIELELDKLGYLEHDTTGGIKRSRWVRDQNKTGLVFIPSKWADKSDDDSKNACAIDIF